MNSRTSTSNPVLFGIVVLITVIMVGSGLIYSYLEQERARDLQNWEIRLGLIADSRVEAINRLLSADLVGLRELANNASLQLYLSQLSAATEAQTTGESAQYTYLRNLIMAAAQREGLADRGTSNAIRANIPATPHSGLALVDAEGNILVSTPGMPRLGAAHQQALEQALQQGDSAIIDLHRDAGEQVAFGYAVPVQGIQGTASAGINGALLAVKPAGQSLFPLLASSRLLAGDDETLLINQDRNQVIYLSPGREGAAPYRRLAMDTPDLAAALALTRPGHFIQGRDYRGMPVLAISRTISGVPWLLVQKTETTAALKDARQHRDFLLTSFSLLLFFIAAALVAAWRHGSSVRAQQTADQLQTKTRELDAQTHLLHGITDHIDAYTALLNPAHELMFANRPFAEATGVTVQDLRGKSLASILGPDTAASLINAIDDNAPGSRNTMLSMTIGGHPGLYQCTFVPLMPDDPSNASLLLVLHDVTELQDAQARRSQLMRKLVGALMQVVDMHDPHSGHHSLRMVEVANAIGAAMHLGDSERETLDMAASLANLGKIFVPREILTKTEPLTSEETQAIRKHVQYTLDILKDLDFEGPVLDTIRQKHENLDGSGYPAGLQGDELLLTARILAVANTFVALMSPRAYRDSTTLQSALDRLLEDTGTKYDRQVVAALFHVAENEHDWSDWAGEKVG